MNIKKFNDIIFNLKLLEAERPDLLHPLIKEKIKRQIMSRLGGEPQTVVYKTAWQNIKYKIFRYVVSGVLAFSVFGGTALASNNSKPGDMLFPLKKAGEKVALGLAGSQQARVALEIKFANRRLKELREIRAETQTPVNSLLFISSEALEEGNLPGDNPSISNPPRQKNPKRTQIKTKSELKAEMEITGAINSLTRIQTNLKIKKDSAESASIQSALVNLKAGISGDTGDNEGVKGQRGDKSKKSSQENINFLAPGAVPGINLETTAGAEGGAPEERKQNR